MTAGLSYRDYFAEYQNVTGKEQMPKFSICIIGDGAVGKSAFMFRYLFNVWVPETDPTIMDAYPNIMESNGVKYNVKIIDYASRQAWTTRSDESVYGSDGFMLAYAINNCTSFETLTGWHDDIVLAKEEHNLPHPKWVILGCKSDLDSDRQVTSSMAAELAKKWGAIAIETSSLNGNNVKEAFTQMACLVSGVYAGTGSKKKASTIVYYYTEKYGDKKIHVESFNDIWQVTILQKNKTNILVNCPSCKHQFQVTTNVIEYEESPG